MIHINAQMLNNVRLNLDSQQYQQQGWPESVCVNLICQFESNGQHSWFVARILLISLIFKGLGFRQGLGP